MTNFGIFITTRTRTEMRRTRLLATLHSVVAVAAIVLVAGVTACSKNTADLELDAARKAMDKASAKKASDCATAT
ncbi:MAG: hypothetical protein H6729_15955, partial [Deltaproteobacteria bacterium]|nr:hypothetical protein [Deltaproteobacteria bacterium]